MTQRTESKHIVQYEYRSIRLGEETLTWNDYRLDFPDAAAAIAALDQIKAGHAERPSKFITGKYRVIERTITTTETVVHNEGGE